MSKCPVPPSGWECSREAGHDGPCAAVRAQPSSKSSNDLVLRLRGLGDPKEWASNHAVALCDEAATEIECLRKLLDGRTFVTDEPSVQAPIARINVMDNGLVGGAYVYAPGLPEGEYDLFIVPPNPNGRWVPFGGAASETPTAPAFQAGDHVRFVSPELDHNEWVVYRTDKNWVYLYLATDRCYTHFAKPEQLRLAVSEGEQ